MPVVAHFRDPAPPLIAYLQRKLDARPESFAAGIVVSDTWPEPDVGPVPKRWVVVRSDGGSDLTMATRSVSLGVSVRAPTRVQSSALADLVATLIRVAYLDSDMPLATSEVSGGPYPLTDDTYQNTITYMTVGAVLTGNPFTI